MKSKGDKHSEHLIMICKLTRMNIPLKKNGHHMGTTYSLTIPQIRDQALSVITGHHNF